MRESSIERAAVRELERRGFSTVKVGFCGLPDRLILLGDGRHFWLEFKNEEGRLRPAQKIVIRKLRERGDHVYVPRSVADTTAALEAELLPHDHR